jgi:alkylation response protein AidB-like acyl-CoA dehydrogenase
MSYHDALARVIDEVVAPGAAEVDAAGVFPRRQIEALAGAGLLGLTVPAEFSGGGEGLRAASCVVRELGAVCGSTAITAVEQGRPDAQLQVLEVKAAAGEAAADAADLALRACGGAAFRKESPVERLFRDSRAARVMAPTTDALYDFIGRALCGLPLLGDVA